MKLNARLAARACCPARPPAGPAGAGGASEAELVLPDLASARVPRLRPATTCCSAAWSSACSGFSSALVMYIQLKNLPVHRSMREISELIYETCKTYLDHPGQVHPFCWVFIAAIMVVYFGVAAPLQPSTRWR